MLPLVLALSMVSGDNPYRASHSAATSHALQRGEAAIFMRYVWVPEWLGAEGIVAHVGVMNALSGSGRIQFPEFIGNGVYAWDARRLCPQDPSGFCRVWDSLAVRDPYFHIAKPLVAEAEQQTPISAPYLDSEMVQKLAASSLSPSLVYRSDWLSKVAFSTGDRGSYYEFLKLMAPRKEGQTDQEYFFSLTGADEKLSKSLNGDHRSMMAISQVTGSPRRIDVYRGAVNNVFITRDVEFSQASADIQKSPIANVLAFNDDAREAMLIMRNGMIAAALFDDSQRFQAEVPISIAVHRGRAVVSAISCYDCHGQNEGWQPAPSVFRPVLGQLDIVDDVSTGLTREQAVDRIATIYEAGIDRQLQRARDDFNDAARRIVTGLGEDIRQGDESYAQALCRAISAVHYGYRDGLITQAIAVREVGGLEGQKLNELIPTRPNQYEDPAITLLKADIPIRRYDFERVIIDLLIQENQK